MSDDVLEQAVEKLHGTFEHTDLDVQWRKIQQKIEEARYNPGDVKPFADCILSVLLAARSNGFSARAVLTELDKVASEMLTKRWKKMPDGTYQSM